jgi:hypothetical protein
MSELRKCAVCSVDLEPRLVEQKVFRPTDGVWRKTKVRAMPRHARVRLAWEGSVGAAPDFEAKALAVCVCAGCVVGRRIGEVLAVLADRFLEAP